MRSKPVSGRAASEEERQYAAKLAKLTRDALASPDGEVCVNPGDPPEERTYWTLESLVGAVEHFARHGRFAEGSNPMDPNFFIRHDALQLKKRGVPRGVILWDLSKKYSQSKETIERIVRGISFRKSTKR
jgi:hypothetical protein